MHNIVRYLGPLCAALLGILYGTAPGWAITEREEILVGRIAHIEGDLMRYVEETKDWTLTVPDAPFGLEDTLYAGNNAKAELILPNETWMRIGEDTQVQMIDLNADATTVDVASGLARLYNRSRDVVIKATTPFGYVVAPAGSAFDLYVGDESLEVIAVRGEVDFVHEASGTRYPVRQGGNSIIADRQTTTTGNGTVDGPWEDWNNQRESVWAGRQQRRTSSANLLPAPIREDAYALEDNGRWERVYYDGDYRDLWRPTRVDSGWRPFTNGRWVDYYGDNCWIPSESFGYVTHHYGSWVYVDAFHAWYWMPPAPRRAMHRPGLTISFGWYPGRVGWFHHGRDIGWVPLAPNEDYYGYRHWGHRTKVIRDHAPMMNLSRYHYLNHASIIDRDHLYRGERYPHDLRRDVNKTVIINQYKPVTQWNDYRQDKRRFDFGDRHIDRKPHAETVERIRENDRRRKEIDRMDRGRIERDLQQVKVSRDIPTKTDIRPPKNTSKIVDADKRTAPLDRGSLPTREFKPKERERVISSETRHGFDANGPAERRTEGSDRFNQRPPQEQESRQRLRSPRDRQVEESGNRSLGESQQQERQRGPRDPQELRRNREEQRSGDGQRPNLSGEQQRQGRDGRELPGRGETEQVRPQRPEKAEAEGESREGLSTGGRDRFNRPTSEAQRQGQQGLEAGERQRPERPSRPELQRQAEQEQRSQGQFDRRQREQQEQQQQAEQADQRRRQGEERLQQQREQQETLQRRQDEGLRRQQEQDRKSQAEAREQEMQRGRQQQLRQPQEQQDQQQELQRRQQREADDRQQQRLQQQREQSQQQEMMQRRQQESERQQQEALRNRQAEERQQEAQREQQQQLRRQQQEQQQEMQRRQQQEAERSRQQEMRRQQEAQREQQQQMRRQQEQQQQEMQRRQQQEAERSRQQEMRRQQEQAQREQQQELQRQRQEQQRQQQQEQQRKKKALTPEELQKLNQGN